MEVNINENWELVKVIGYIESMDSSLSYKYFHYFSNYILKAFNKLIQLLIVFNVLVIEELQTKTKDAHLVQ